MNQTEAAAGLAVWVAQAASPSRRAALRREAPRPWRPSADLLPQLAELAAELADLDRVVVAGPALAAQAIARTLGRPLTVLDTAEPGPVRRALADHVERTVVVLTETGAEVEAVRRVCESAFRAAGFSDAEIGRRFVTAVPSDRLGLAPVALAGVDVVELVDQAEGLGAALGGDGDDPGLALATALGEAFTAGRDTVALVSDGTGFVGLAEWVARRLVEAAGVRSVVLESPDAPVSGGPDVLTVTLGGALPPGAVPGGGIRPDVAVNGPLGAQFAVWEYAAAALPTLRPPVIEASPTSLERLEGRLDQGEPAFVEGSVAGYGTSAGGVTEAIGALLLATRPDGHLAVSAHLDRYADAAIADIRRPLAAIAGRPVAFEWGGGYPGAAAHLQITGAVPDDMAVPGTPYTLGDVRAAGAAAERAALARRGHPVVRLHLTDRPAGIKQLLDAASALGS